MVSLSRHSPLCLVLMAALAAAAPRAEAEPLWTPSEDDALLLELRAGSFTADRSISGYQTPGGVCLEWNTLVEALDLPVRIDSKLRRATGWFFFEDRQFEFDRSTLTLSMKGQAPEPLDARDIVDTPGGWCIALAALSKWSGVTFRADLSRSSLMIESDRKLPFQAALDRKARASRLTAAELQAAARQTELSQLPQVDVPYRLWRTPSFDLQVRSAWSSNQRALTSYEALAAGDLLGLSYSGRVAGSQWRDPDSVQFKLYRKDPAGGLLGPLAANQFAVGDVDMKSGNLSGRSVFGRGVYVSNRLLQLPSRFGVTTLRGTLPAGWEAELYRNGVLRAVQADRGDGRYEFSDVELQFGDNDFEVALYGPQGQVRRERFSQRMGTKSLAPGQLQYWAGFVDSGKDLLGIAKQTYERNAGWRWNTGFEYGLDSRTTGGLGYQSLYRNGQRQHYLEGLVRRSLGSMLMELSGAQQTGAGQAFRIEGMGRIHGINLSGNAIWTNGAFDSDLVPQDRRGEFSLRMGGAARIADRHVMLETGLRQMRLRSGNRSTELSARASFPFGRSTLTAELLDRRWGGAQQAGARYEPSTWLNLIGFSQINRIRLRGNASIAMVGPHPGLQRTQIAAELPSGRRDFFRLEFQHDSFSRTQSYAVGYAKQFRHFALRGDARVDNRGKIGAAITLMVGLGPDYAGGGWRMSGERLATLGQLDVEVFRDDNADGVRQANEPVLPDVAIQGGMFGQRSLTNAKGHAVIEGLAPFQPTRVAIDATSLPDPLLQPTGPGIVVVPRPGVAASIALPVVATGEVEAVLLGPNERALGGVDVELTDARGTVVNRQKTDAGGYVWFDLVPYGAYRLRLAQGDAIRLGLVAELGSELRIDPGKSSLRMGRVRASRLAPIQDALRLP